MKIKKRDKPTFSLKRFKKIKIFFIILILMLTIFVGLISGLLISGYFGTLDNPSELAIDIIHSLGITDLRSLQTKIKLNIGGNVLKVPLNYISGQFSNPERIFIDINFKDYQILEYKRQEALDSKLYDWSREDYVPAIIRYNNEEIKVKLRLKGDGSSHLDSDKISFRIKVKNDDTLFGMKVFSIQHPKERAYLNELIYLKALERENILSVSYDFIEVFINGENKGIYAIEGHFNKELIESNNRREGVILKFNENAILVYKIRVERLSLDDSIEEIAEFRKKFGNEFFFESNIESFDDEDILLDPVLSKQFITAKSLLESFRNEDLKTSEVFDIDKLATYYAVTDILLGSHASSWTNIRFYYNPVTSLLEPIGYDAEILPSNIFEDFYMPDCSSNNCFRELLFKDKIFYRKYMAELERVSEKSYLDNLFLELDEDIKRSIKIIYKDNPFYYYTNELFYLSQERIRSKLNPIDPLHIYLKEINMSNNKVILSVENVDMFPLEIINLVYNDSITFELNENRLVEPKPSFKITNYQDFEFNNPNNFIFNNNSRFNFKVSYKILGTSIEKIVKVQPYYIKENLNDFIRQESNLSSYDMLSINESSKSISIKKGNWILNQSLIIPKGFTVFFEQGTNIDIVNEATILSYSSLQFSGTKENPIKIFSSDGTGQGITVLNVDKVSNINYVTFDNLNAPSKDGWELTGAVNFYKSPVVLDRVFILKSNSEDGLNIIDSKFEVKYSMFQDCSFDCFDNDFGEGIIKSCSFINCGNDCLDLSGSVVNIEEVNISKAGDKGISAGEESKIIVRDVKISETYIAVASKDKSEVFIEDSEILNAEYTFAIYEKKSEYGGALINADNIKFNNEYIIEKGSNLLIDNVIILDKKKEVYEILYGEQKFEI